MLAVATAAVKSKNVTCLAPSDCSAGLGCFHSVCGPCATDAACRASPSDVSKHCAHDHTSSVCMDKDVFSPFTSTDFLTAFLAILSTALGSACGLGGGGLLVPIYIVVGGLNPKFAIPLSKATIFGGALATFYGNFRHKHPHASRRPVIDYALAAMMEPPTLIGTIFGVMANTVCPAWLILALLVSLIVFVTRRTLDKANKVGVASSQIAPDHSFQMYASETSGTLLHKTKKPDAVAPSSASLSPTARHDPTNDDDDDDDNDDKNPSSSSSHNTQDSVETQTLLRDEANLFPFKTSVLPLVLGISVIFGQGLLRGGHGATSIVGISCGSPGFWLLILPPVALLAWITYAMAKVLMHRTRVYEANSIEPVQGDVQWTPFLACISFPAHCVLAGIAASLLGIGGGIIQGPIMMEHGILPLVQSATSSYMILFTSSATTIQFVIAGQFPGHLQYDYVLWYAFLGFLGGVLGKTVVEYLIHKSGRMSLVLYFLAVNGVIQVLVMGYIGVLTVIHDVHIGANLGFTSLCDGV
ncbi:Aste57867_21848 [Aphanomyces stellatus]|uniref:Aste57867_21848 protein n=1 Tax=Aphanomyces stellatus TaxID=120398 RepID=A0A485LKP3_9STRA|nr:hypothetical protein As57867_021779 [Aphanomyces stellatus]VFT98517.1 Aste57867_21848 [Aphanomyces stellatus]